MSITFRPSPTPASQRELGHRLVCPADPAQDRRRFVTFDLAVAALYDHAEHCCEPDCGPGAPFPVTDRAGDDEPRLDVAQDNGIELLRLLGLAPWPTGDDLVLPTVDPTRPLTVENPAVGQIPTDDLTARITLALVLSPKDPGRPWHTTDAASRAGGSRFIDCGRPVGHLQDLLERLRRLAVFAEVAGRDVGWA